MIFFIEGNIKKKKREEIFVVLTKILLYLALTISKT